MRIIRAAMFRSPFPRTALAVLLLSSSLAAAAEPRLVPPPAKKATKQKVLPLALSLGDSAMEYTAQVQYILESALKRAQAVELVDPFLKFDPAGLELRAQRASKGMSSLADGRKGYENLDDGLGAEHFERALQSFQESALWENFKPFSQALAWRILIRWNEDQINTKKELLKLIAIDPKAEFPPDLTPPDLLAEVQKARDAVKAEQKFALDVSTEPVAARVYVDGVYKGTTRTSVRGLVSGEHYLSLVAPGFAVVQKAVRVGAGATATETLKEADRSKPFHVFMERIRKGFGENEEVTAAQVMGRRVEADQVLVAGVKRESGQITVVLHRISMDDGHVLGISEVNVAEKDIQFAQIVNDLAVKNLGTDRERGPNGEVLGVKSTLDKVVKSITSVDPEKVKLGIGIGGGALFLTGAIIGLVAWGKEGEARTLVQNDGGTADALSSGFHTAIAADVFMVVGLTAGATWGWLQFGRALAKKADIEAPPVLEKQKDGEITPDEDEDRRRKRRQQEADDPFNADASPVPPTTIDLFAFSSPYAETP